MCKSSKRTWRFWLPCKLHIGETILRHVWEDLKGKASKAPEVTIFSRFQINFSSLLLQNLDQVNCHFKLYTTEGKLQENIKLL